MGFKPRLRPSSIEVVNEFTDRMKFALNEVKLALAKAKDNMARFYNRRRVPAPIYKAGDKVYLNGTDIKTN